MKGIKKTYLEDGLLEIQTATTSWTYLRLKINTRATRNRGFQSIPLENAYGKNETIARSNRAFRFEFFDQNSSFTKKVHLRGVSEDFALYGKAPCEPSERDKIAKCEDLFYKPVLLDGTSVAVRAGRIDKKKGRSFFQPFQACMGRGIVTMPEQLDTKTREKRKLARKLGKKSNT